MNTEENTYVECDSLSALDITVDNVVQVLLGHEEEVQKLYEKKQVLNSEMKKKQNMMLQIQFEKAELESELARLKLRNAAYQREHSNLRNAITIARYQIEKIKDCISKARTKEMENLKEFENSVDEITEKFRMAPDEYAREKLLDRVKEEKNKKNELVAEIEKLTNIHMEFVRQKGLRPGKDESEDMVDCVMPGSELFSLIEITKNLEQVGSEIEALMLRERDRKESN